MTHTELMKMLHTFEYLVKEFGSVDIIDPIILDDVIEKLSGISMLHNQVQLAFCFDYLIQLNYTSMPDLL